MEKSQETLYLFSHVISLALNLTVNIANAISNNIKHFRFKITGSTFGLVSGHAECLAATSSRKSDGTIGRTVRRSESSRIRR